MDVRPGLRWDPVGGIPGLDPRTSGNRNQDMKATRMSVKRDNRNGSTAKVLPLLALLGLGACSSGGGGGEEEDEIGLKPTPSVVTFSMNTGGSPLTIEYAGETVELNALMSGFYHLEQDEWASDANTMLSIDSGSLFGNLDLFVSDRFQGAAWEDPRSGEFVVQQASTNDVITVTVNGAVGGVDIHYDAGGNAANRVGPFTYTWEEFSDLLGSSTVEYEEIASFAWGALEQTRERFLVVVETFVAIFDTAPTFESIGPEQRFGISGVCGTLPGSGNFGDAVIVWHDVNGTALVETGDAFTLTLENCWVDVPGRFDRLLEGEVRLTGFSCTESPFSTGANLEFVGFEERVTEEVGGVFSILPDLDTVTNGASAVLFL